MEKRDVIMVVMGLVIVLVIALVAKPMLTGKPVDMSVPVAIPGLATPTPTPTPAAVGADDSYEKYKASQNAPASSPNPTTTPAPTPSWSGQAQGLSLTNPQRYNQTPTPTPIPHSGVYNTVPEQEDEMVTYATIEGTYPGVTNPIHMPFPYWELRYTIDPADTLFVSSTESKAAGVATNNAAQSFPSFSITVQDADQPNRTIRVITPHGGIDEELWKKDTNSDPRPWTEKFYEGVEDHNYFFTITPHMITSYKIEVLVPKRYIGKY